MTKPSVSIIVAVYNAEAYLEESLDSILNQTWKDWEMILVNDCSTDGSLSLCQAYAQKDSRIRVIALKTNLGALGARNVALKEAEGKYFAIQDADDVSLEMRLEKQVDYLNTHQDIVLLGSQTLIIDEKGQLVSKRDYPYIAEDIRKTALKANPFAHSAIMARTDIIRQMGYYPQSKHKIAEDYSLWLRVLSEFDGANINEALIKYRLFFNDDKNSVKQKLINTIRAQRPWLFNARLFSFAALFYHLAEHLMLLLPKSLVLGLFKLKNLQSMENSPD